MAVRSSRWEAAAGLRPGGGQTGWGTGPGGRKTFDFGQFFGERFGGDNSGTFSDIFSQFRRAGNRKKSPASRALT